MVTSQLFPLCVSIQRFQELCEKITANFETFHRMYRKGQRPSARKYSTVIIVCQQLFKDGDVNDDSPNC